MFTGIIESRGTVQNIHQEGSNVHFNIASDISSALKIDQSLSHNGVCLTVVGIKDNVHTVTAVEETLKRSNLGQWQVGSLVNLERAMLSNGRLDGHIVQGHVDGTAHCIKVEDRDGSWNFHFQYTPTEEHLLVDKGSVCINGVSLTVVSPAEDRFSVAIIPYTFEHTTFQSLQEGDLVNLEFDVIGKYIAQYAKLYFKPTLVP
ncbi:riboflavin synthase [Haliscomenobacter sp.]|uniref:riboflavin synthase n=1 Tax=Haliscomenobacter sp. TaxID=2717303 RepID=UPI003364D14C